MIIMMTRWNDYDLVGYVKDKFAEDNWECYNFEAICEDEANDPCGRKAGEALWPTWYSVDTLQKIKTGLRTDWDALYQGRPISDIDGGLLKAAELRFVDELSGDGHFRHVASWDLGVSSATTSDYSVGTLWRISDTSMTMVDYVRGHFTFPELCDEITKLGQGLPFRQIVVEHCHSGINVKDTLRLRHVSVELFQPRSYGSKVERFQKSMSDYQSGVVTMLRELKDTHTDFGVCIDEILKFGTTRHDDFVDSCTQAVLFVKPSSLVPVVARPSELSPTAMTFDGNRKVYGNSRRFDPRSRSM
jgi:phage terminase large subunit-like protein